MALSKLNHYSLTSPASVYDEEALTALELAARTAKKVNDCVEAFNELEGTIETHVDKSVNEHIASGDFDKQIEKHTTAITREVEGLFDEVNNLDHRIDNLVVNGSENSPEVIDIRSGADNITYKTAGSAVRGQLRKKVDLDELYTVEYETGSIGITASGWDYDETFGKNSRVRNKEGKELKLKAGDVIGLRDYSDARYYLGFRVGDTYTFAGWLTSDYTITTACECVILVAHGTDVNLNTPENPDILGSLIFVRKNDGIANRAHNANENINTALDVDLGFILGGMNPDGVYCTFNRYVTRDILRLDVDIVVKRSDRNRIAVYTFTDKAGNGVVDKGWVTDKGDYIIKAGTYFRLMVMPESYDVEALTVINPSEQYDADLYKSIVIEPLNGCDINLMHSARTLARVNTFKTMSRAHKVVTPRKVRAVNHRGYNYEATENTEKAFKLSKVNGFDFVECDVRFTSDDVPVLFHDDTVDRISDGTGRVCDKTLAELEALDLGGEKILTFDAFVKLCATLQVHPYIEIEPDGDNAITREQTKKLMDIVVKYGMTRFVTWISFRPDDLIKVIELDPFARVGYIITAEDINVVNTMKKFASLMTGLNEAFIDVAYANTALTSYIDECVKLGAPLEVWTINDDYADGIEVVKNNPYISGVTSDNADIGKLIIDAMVNPPKVEMGQFTYHSGETGELLYTCDFEIGMTWREFINSAYNKDGFKIYDDGSGWEGPQDSRGQDIYTEGNAEHCGIDELIMNGHAYESYC